MSRERSQKRRDPGSRRSGRASRSRSHLAGTRGSSCGRDLPRRNSVSGEQAPHPGGVPGTPVHRRGLRRENRPLLADHARKDLSHPARRTHHIQRYAQSIRRHPLSFPVRGSGIDSRVSRGQRMDGRGGDHGRKASHTCGGGSAVPSGIHTDPFGSEDSREFHQDMREGGTP